MTKAAVAAFVTQGHTHASTKHVLMCGDSTVARLLKSVQLTSALDNATEASTLKQSTRCGLMEYYGLPRAQPWTHPLEGFEGPVGYGLQHPFCTDCSGCNADFVGLYNATTRQLMHTFEYVPVEFILDREFQTDTTDTSQQTLLLYLQKTFRRDLCIASSGLHDVILTGFDYEQHTRNVLHFLHLLHTQCDRIIWLTVSATQNEAPQLLDRLEGINHHMRQACHLLPPNVIIVNTWNLSLPLPLHVDNVHHKEEYYQVIARVLFSSLLSPLHWEQA